MIQDLRGFAQFLRIVDSDDPRAKRAKNAKIEKSLFFFAALRSLRETFRSLVAALLR